MEVVTFGCRLNTYESGQAKARALSDGLTDAVIFNTCAVTGEAVRQGAPGHPPHPPRTAGRQADRHRLRRPDRA